MKSSPSSPNSLHTWRLQELNWILRVLFPFGLLAYLTEVWRALQAYRETAQTTPNATEVLTVSLSIYSIVLAFLVIITFFAKIPYHPRLFVLLGAYYFLGVIQFSLYALNGDARSFLYGFVVLAAVFLDKPWNLLSLALALIAFAVMGALNVSGIISLPAQLRFNAADPSAWLSGGIVFAAISISTSLGITYLLRSFAASLDRANQSLQNERLASNSLRLLSDVNQLIVRECRPAVLLERACQIIVENGYDHAWVALLQADGTSLALSASAGGANPPEPLPEFAAQALNTRAIISSPPALAIPILRPERTFGVLVIARPQAASEFNQQETALFEELAGDLAYALENIETETQRHLIAETAAPLLTARDETEFWSAVLPAVQAILRADRAAVYIYEYGTDRLTCPYSAGLSQAYVDEVNRRFHEIPGGRILRDPQPVPVNDAESDPSAAPLRPLLQREGIRSYIVFPLFSANKLLGAFVAYRNALSPFSQPDLEAGQTLAHLIAASLQNARLFTETRAKAAEQSALFIAAQEISASLLNPPALLETLAKQLAAVLDATSVYVISLTSSGETLTVLAEYWSESASPAERKSDLRRVYPTRDYPHVIQSMRSGKPLSLQADQPNLTEAERREYTEYVTHSKLFVPLLAQGQLVGYAEIWESRRKREFTQHEIHLAQALSSHAASVIQNARLAEGDRKHLTTLTALNQINLDLSAHLELPTLLNAIVDRAMNLLNASMGCLYLMEPDGQSLTIVVGRGGLQEYIGARLPLGEGLSGKIAQTGESLLIPNYKTWEGRSAVFDALNVGAVMGVPIQWRGRVLGVININDVQPNRFDLEDVKLIALFAAQSAVALENARHYNQLEARESYFRALTENSAEGIAVVNENAQFTFVSQQEEKMLGYPLLQVIGEYAFDITHPDDLSHVKKYFHQVVQNAGNMAQFEYRARHADGTWRWIEVMFKNLLYDPSVKGVVVNFRDITERKLAEERLAQAYDSTLEGWARALELRDKDTEGHTRRVTDLAVQLARAMNLPEEQIIHLRRGAILHDIGKVAVPDRILHKTGPLAPDEQTVMRRHPRYAHEMLYPIVYLRPTLDIPYCHHEKWDGTGYPRGLKGEDIPLPARIFAIADVWDALTSDRPYRPAWDKEKTIDYIKEESGKYFDPQVVRVFLSLLEKDQNEKS